MIIIKLHIKVDLSPTFALINIYCIAPSKKYVNLQKKIKPIVI